MLVRSSESPASCSNQRRFGVTMLMLAAVALGAAGMRAQTAAPRGFTADAAIGQFEREQRLRAVANPDRIREYARAMSARPHMAGTAASREVAEYALTRFKEFGLDAWIEEYHALMAYPKERNVEVLGPEPARLELREPPLAADPDSANPTGVPTFNAYAADGDVTGEVVYVNYGTPADFAELEKQGIDVRGRIVLARYGQSWRGIKPKVAEERGAIGCLIYSDPRDDGYWRGVVYPEGAWRPEHGVQRGSVIDMTLYPGDPLTPGWANERGARQLDRREAGTLLRIPVMPISYGDALPILRQLGGAVAPEPWRGALPTTYRLGPGPARVRLAVSFDWQVRPLFNVLARVRGARWPDQWVIYGNHHDAWVNGATDPVSGAAALLETARAVADSIGRGWKPARTILFALWDGEEWGLLGSTEWAEKHEAELRDQAVVYMNSDSTSRGWLHAGGSHSLESLVNEVAVSLADPDTGRSLRDEARARDLERADAEQRRALLESPALRLRALGSGSDYTTFLDHLAIASLNLGFGGESEGGVYHSVYDSFSWYTRFGDPAFSDGAMLSRTVVTLIARFAEASFLPFQFVDTARTVATYVTEIEQEWKDAAGAPSLDFGPLWAAIGELRRAADDYETAFASVSPTPDAALRAREDDVAAVNRSLLSVERLWANDEGLPGRPWFKHLLYAPGLYTGYAVKTLPGVREAIEQKRWDEAAQQLTSATAAVTRVTTRLKETTARLQGVTVR